MTQSKESPQTPVAIVTGVSRGFGHAVASALVERGWIVVGDARGGIGLNDVARHQGSSRNISVPGDVSDPSHRLALINTAVETGPLRLLINNASRLGPSPQPALADYPADELGAVYATNVFAPLALTQQALPALIANAGTVVNVTSDAAVEPYPGWGGYGSSKAALEQISAILAAEVPAVAVYVFDPGDMRTEMHQDAFPGEDISDRPLPSAVAPGLVALIESDHPSGRTRVAEFVS